MPALFLPIEKYAEMSWAVGVFKDSRSTSDSSGFPLNHEVEMSLEARQLKFLGSLPFPVTVDHARSYTNLL